MLFGCWFGLVAVVYVVIVIGLWCVWVFFWLVYGIDGGSGMEIGV